jgi:hypothetical protein
MATHAGLPNIGNETMNCHASRSSAKPLRRWLKRPEKRFKFLCNHIGRVGHAEPGAAALFGFGP